MKDRVLRGGIADTPLPDVMGEQEMMLRVHLHRQDIDLTKWWVSKDRRWHRIEAMDFSHLQNIVDLMSQPGKAVHPDRQTAFDNVVLEYFKKKVDNDALYDKALQLMENIDGIHKETDDGEYRG